eukprot:jgi/Mesvir1/2637/Mv26186-RA.1
MCKVPAPTELYWCHYVCICVIKPLENQEKLHSWGIYASICHLFVIQPACNFVGMLHGMCLEHVQSSSSN